MSGVALVRFRLCFFAEHHEVDLRQPGLGHSAFAYQLAQPSFVQRRPLGAVATRSELLRELFVVDPLDDAIDPAEAQGLLDRMVVRNARPTGVFLVVDEPNLGLRLVMLREPGAPFLPAGYIQRLAYFHFVLSAAVEDNDHRRTVASWPGGAKSFNLRSTNHVEKHAPAAPVQVVRRGLEPAFSS